MALSFIKEVSDVWLVGKVRSDITEVVTNIVNADSKDAAFEAAEEATAGFEIPSSVVASDENALREVGDVESLIARRQEASRESRFNMARCSSWFADDEEYSILQELAIHGAVIDTAPGFIPSNSPGPDRPILSRLRHTLLWHAFELHRKGKPYCCRWRPLSRVICISIQFTGLPNLGKQRVAFFVICPIQRQGVCSMTKLPNVLSKPGTVQ